MDLQLFSILFFTFVIHLIGTLAYSARVAGTRTGQIAISFALFNIMMLASRTANSFQGPLIGKRIEENLNQVVLLDIQDDFRLILLSATAATACGIFAMPSFQRLFTAGVERFRSYRSIPRLLMRGFTPTGLAHIKNSMTIPTKESLRDLQEKDRIPLRFIIFNTLTTAIWTVGVLSALYAGFLAPEYRLTASQLSAVINGGATILMIMFIDPYVAMMTDDVARGEKSQAYLRRSVILLLASRIAGTLLAQVFLLPSAHIIVAIAKWL